MSGPFDKLNIFGNSAALYFIDEIGDDLLIQCIFDSRFINFTHIANDSNYSGIGFLK